MDINPKITDRNDIAAGCCMYDVLRLMKQSFLNFIIKGIIKSPCVKQGLIEFLPGNIYTLIQPMISEIPAQQNGVKKTFRWMSLLLSSSG